jgi:hypothetical protein
MSGKTFINFDKYSAYPREVIPKYSELKLTPEIKQILSLDKMTTVIIHNKIFSDQTDRFNC